MTRENERFVSFGQRGWLLDLIFLTVAMAVLAGSGLLVNLWQRWRGVSEKSKV
jgi:hypothetical protein